MELVPRETAATASAVVTESVPRETKVAANAADMD